MDKIKLGIVVVLLVLLAGNVALGAGFYLADKKAQQAQQQARLNQSVLNFANLFIAKVLKAPGEISFEDRLKIENAVRDTQDPQIIAQWAKFIDAQDEATGREEIKNLLQLIINKISAGQ